MVAGVVASHCFAFSVSGPQSDDGASAGSSMLIETPETPLSPLSDASGTVDLVPRAPTAPQDPSEAVTAALALFAIPVCYERYRTDALVLLCADGEASMEKTTTACTASMHTPHVLIDSVSFTVCVLAGFANPTRILLPQVPAGTVCQYVTI